MSRIEPISAKSGRRRGVEGRESPRGPMMPKGLKGAVAARARSKMTAGHSPKSGWPHLARNEYVVTGNFHALISTTAIMPCQ